MLSNRFPAILSAEAEEDGDSMPTDMSFGIEELAVVDEMTTVAFDEYEEMTSNRLKTSSCDAKGQTLVLMASYSAAVAHAQKMRSFLEFTTSFPREFLDKFFEAANATGSDEGKQTMEITRPSRGGVFGRIPRQEKPA